MTLIVPLRLSSMPAVVSAPAALNQFSGSQRLQPWPSDGLASLTYTESSASSLAAMNSFSASGLRSTAGSLSIITRSSR